MSASFGGRTSSGESRTAALRRATIWILALFALSCTHSTEPPPDTSNFHFPLEVGTIWRYNTCADTVLYESSVNDTSYVAVHGPGVGFWAGGPDRLVRYEDDELFIRLAGVDQLLLDFDSPVGAEWAGVPLGEAAGAGTYHVKVVSKILPWEWPPGTMRSCTEFYWWIPHWTDTERFLVACDGVGIVYVQEWLDRWSLEELTIPASAGS